VCNNGSTEESGVYVTVPQQRCLLKSGAKEGSNVCVIVAQRRVIMYV